jgi:hypothetical protein
MRRIIEQRAHLGAESLAGRVASLKRAARSGKRVGMETKRSI